MADPRPPRFRLPWLLPQTTTPAPASASAQVRPVVESQPPPRSATAGGLTPRPPFRPPGQASLLPPPRAEPPPRAAAQPRDANQRPPSPPKPQPATPPLLARPPPPSSPGQVIPRVPPLENPQTPPKREHEPKQEISQNSSTFSQPEKLKTQQDIDTAPSDDPLKPTNQPQSTTKEPMAEVSRSLANEEPGWKEIPSPGSSRMIPRDEIFQKKEVVATTEAQKPSEPFIPHHTKFSRARNHRPATPSGERAPMHSEIKEDISKLVHKLGTGQGKLTLDGDKTFTIITLAGENRGALMNMANEEGKRERPVHIHRGYRMDQDEITKTPTDAEHGGSKAEEETGNKAYINSNVQGVNNSLVFNGSVSTGSPGVQYAISRNLTEHSEGNYKAHQMHKDEFNITPSEKHAYAPTVGQCLEGIFLDSDGSDGSQGIISNIEVL